jgi:ribonuclease-3
VKQDSLNSFLDYRFRDPDLLETALTHRSASSRHNERLEFLGDALLGFLIADVLHTRFPQADEGALTRTRAALVNRESLAEIAREFEVGALLHLGDGERKSGGWRRSSILANAIEAVTAAIYLDGGLDACRAEVLRWFESRLATIDPALAPKDAKTALQEYLQARRRALPTYRTIAEEGPPHRRSFTVECLIEGCPPIVAESHSRRAGEQDAARAALQRLRAGELP